MKKIYASVMLLCAVVLLSSLSDRSAGDCLTLHRQLEKSAGPPSCYAGELPQSNTCDAAGCHNDFPLNIGSAHLNLYLGGADTGYIPGQTYIISISLVRNGMIRSGFQITALQDNDITITPGTITLIDSNGTQLVNAANPHTGPCLTQNKTWVEHTIDGIDNIMNSDSSYWHFKWKAPSSNVGTITFYVASIDANKDLDCTGDTVYAVHKTISVAAGSTGISELLTDNDFSVSPMPFLNELQVKTTSHLTYSYSIIDMNGKNVLDGSVSNGASAISTESLMPGVYLFELKDAHGAAVKRIIKM